MFTLETYLVVAIAVERYLAVCRQEITLSSSCHTPLQAAGVPGAGAEGGELSAPPAAVPGARPAAQHPRQHAQAAGDEAGHHPGHGLG